MNTYSTINQALCDVYPTHFKSVPSQVTVILLCETLLSAFAHFFFREEYNERFGRKKCYRIQFVICFRPIKLSLTPRKTAGLCIKYSHACIGVVYMKHIHYSNGIFLTREFSMLCSYYLTTVDITKAQ